MPKKNIPGEILSDSERDLLRRAFVRNKGKTEELRKDDRETRKRAVKKIRSMADKDRIHRFFLDCLLINAFIKEEKMPQLDEIKAEIASTEEADNSISGFIKEWIFDEQTGSFLDNLLLPDPVDERTCSNRRTIDVLMFLERYLQAVDSEIQFLVQDTVSHQQIDEILNNLSCLIERQSSGPVQHAYDRSRYMGTIQHGPRSFSLNEGELEKLAWIKKDCKENNLVGSLPVALPKDPKNIYWLEWKFNIPSILLIYLSVGLVDDIEVAQEGLAFQKIHRVTRDSSRWEDVVRLIMKRFSDFDLLAISYKEYKNHPTWYYNDAFLIEKKYDDGSLRDQSERIEEAEESGIKLSGISMKNF